MLGLVAFAGTAPMLVFGLWGGTLADRFSRRRLFLMSQLLAMLQALLLAGCTIWGVVQVWHILTLALVLGVIHAVEMPARQAFIAELVPRADLPNAIGLNSAVLNVSRFLGPALAGWLVGVVGEGGVFGLNAVSFLSVILAVGAIPTEPTTRSRARVTSMRDGLNYVRQNRPIRATLGLIALGSVSGTSYVVLMPVFAREVFGGDAKTLGMLLGVTGLGALIGALRLAYRGRSAGLNVQIGRVGLSAGIGLMLFAVTQALWMAWVILPVIGFSLGTLVAGGNTFVQMQVPDHLRGRVMALFSVIFIGHTPIGNLASGILSRYLGAPATVLLFGAVCTAGAVGFICLMGNARDHSTRQPVGEP